MFMQPPGLERLPLLVLTQVLGAEVNHVCEQGPCSPRDPRPGGRRDHMDSEYRPQHRWCEATVSAAENEWP